MKLNKYDNKLVKIVTIDDEIFEGVADYNSKDYCYHEFGRDKECLQIVNVLFFDDYIKEIKIIDNFTTKYSKLEEFIVEDGIPAIIEAIEEDDIYKERIIKFIKDNKIELIKELKERRVIDA